MHFGDHVEALGDSLGGLGDAFGVLWELLGTRWWLLGTSRDTGGTFQIMFGHFVQPLRKHCKKKVFEGVEGGQGALRAHFGALGDTLTGPGNTFGVLWEPLGTLWMLLGTLWVLFGVLWAMLDVPVRKHCKNPRVFDVFMGGQGLPKAPELRAPGEGL